MVKLSLPTGLQGLTVGSYFKLNMAKVSLPTGLHGFAVGALQVGEVWASPRTACRVER